MKKKFVLLLKLIFTPIFVLAWVVILITFDSNAKLNWKRWLVE